MQQKTDVFFAENSWEKIGSSTFLLGADQRLSGEGVFNGIYYCPLGFRAPCTCIPLCMRLVILMFWLRASILSIVNSGPYQFGILLIFIFTAVVLISCIGSFIIFRGRR